jgi:hypothetical protein
MVDIVWRLSDCGYAALELGVPLDQAKGSMN